MQPCTTAILALRAFIAPPSTTGMAILALLLPLLGAANVPLGGKKFCCTAAATPHTPACKGSDITAISATFDSTSTHVDIEGTVDKISATCHEACSYASGTVAIPGAKNTSDCLGKLLRGSTLKVTYNSTQDALTVAVSESDTVVLTDCGGGARNSDSTGGKSPTEGYMGIAIAAVCFGSNFVVVKKKEWDPKDGLFFQFNMVIGVFFTGMLYHFVVRGAPPLQPIAMLGGAGYAQPHIVIPAATSVCVAF